MRKKRKRQFKHLGTIGSIIWGASFSVILGLLTIPTIELNLMGLLITIGVGFIGCFLVAFDIAEDILLS